MTEKVTSATRTEVVRWPAWLHAAGAAGAALLAAAAGKFLSSEGTRTEGAMLAAGLAAPAWLWWRIRRLVVAAGPGAIAFGFGRPRRAAATLLEARAEDYPFREYLG